MWETFKKALNKAKFEVFNCGKTCGKNEGFPT